MGLFHRCRGDEFKREYFPPSARRLRTYNDRLLEEHLRGVTLVHCRCNRCGEHFVNRELGDTRGDG